LRRTRLQTPESATSGASIWLGQRSGANGGSHGYLNRMVEQMCGQHGPGSVGWSNHVSDLVGAQRKVADGMRTLNSSKCRSYQLLGREEREVAENIANNKTGWSPNTIPWKGRGHPDCANFAERLYSGRLRDILNVVRPQ
jgi:hypothetical protein